MGTLPPNAEYLPYQRLTKSPSHPQLPPTFPHNLTPKRLSQKIIKLNQVYYLTNTLEH